MASREEVQNFIDTISVLARNEYLSRDRWVLPSVCIAQAALESGWNLNASTLFGIKGEGFKAKTGEYYNGHYVEIEDSFRLYPDVASSVVGYYDFITQTPRYAGVVNNADYENAVYCLIHTTDGLPYATSPTYIDKVISIIEQYNLTQYDSRTEATATPTTQATRKTNEEIALEVFRGEWGNGTDRYNRLTNAGYDYNAIQSIVNSMCQQEVPQETHTVSNKVYIKEGARDLNSGVFFADFVYEQQYDVIENDGYRVVFGKGTAVTGVTDINHVEFC